MCRIKAARAYEKANSAKSDEAKASYKKAGDTYEKAAEEHEKDHDRPLPVV